MGKDVISLEVGSTYEITYDDGTVRTFTVQGGPDILVCFKDTDECVLFSSISKNSKTIKKRG